MAELGYSTAGSTSVGSTNDYLHAYGPWTCPASGDVTTIKIYFTGTSSEPCVAGIYSDNGSDYPNAKLMQSGEITLSDGWNEFTLTSTLSVTNGTKYWIVHNKDTSDPDHHYNAGTHYLKYVASAYNTTMPSTYPGSASERTSRDYSGYSEIDEGGGGTGTSINIGDSWKAVGAIKINIGDVWKEVGHAKLNVGDSWKVIF